MDLVKTIQELRIEKEKVEHAIALLEDLMKSHTTTGPTAVKRRGRKQMGPEERLMVSKRMKKYWANRRKLRSK